MFGLLKKVYKRSNRFLNPYRNIPLTRNFGFKRGTPIDRFVINKYVDEFLKSINSESNIKGLEIGGFDYLNSNAKKYEGYELVPFKPDKFTERTLVQNLNLPIDKDLKLKNKFDFIICTQVFSFLKNDIQAINNMHFLLKKNAPIIGSIPGIITPISSYDYERWGQYKGYTDMGVENLLKSSNFKFTIETYGNFQLACEFINGSSIEDINIDLISKKDNLYQILHTFKAYAK